MPRLIWTRSELTRIDRMYRLERPRIAARLPGSCLCRRDNVVTLELRQRSCPSLPAVDEHCRAQNRTCPAGHSCVQKDGISSPCKSDLSEHLAAVAVEIWQLSSPNILLHPPSPRWVKTDWRWLSKRARAFWRFFSALALAVAMPSNASSRMPTIRCCSGSGGMESEFWPRFAQFRCLNALRRMKSVQILPALRALEKERQESPRDSLRALAR